MNIGILVQDITNLGGVETVSIWLAKKLQSKGNSVDLVSCKSKNSSIFENSSNINIIYLNIPAENKYFQKEDFTKLESILKENHYDKIIIQLSTAFKNLCFVANTDLYKLIIKYSKIDLVIHESPKYFITRYNVDYDGFFKLSLKKLYTLVKYVPQIRRFFKLSSKYVNRFVTLSKGCQKELKTCYGLDSVIQYNPYPFDEIPVDVSKKENVVMWCGRLSKEKNLPLLLGAWNLIWSKYPDWKLQIIGSGKDENRIASFIKSKNISNVEIIKAVPHTEIISYMQKNKIYILTSFFEGFPTVISEAMNYKMAVITTRYDGFSDELLEKGTCLITDFNQKDLAEKLEMLLTKPDTLKCIGEAGFTRCKEFYMNVEKQ